jgi:hypothetical protein
LFDYEDIVIGPGEMQTLEIDLPTCATQIDAYYGEVIKDFGSDLPANEPAITFGDRKIFYFHTNTGKGDSSIPLCEKPEPPVEICNVNITGLVDANGGAIGGIYTKHDISSVSAVVEGEPTQVIFALIGHGNTETFTVQGTYTWDDGNVLGNLSNGDYTLKATTYDGEEMCGVIQTGFVIDNPTAVTLQSFDTQVQDERVTILWKTASETDNAGFNIYRAVSEDGPFVKINDNLIIADGQGAFGASYEFVDEPGAGTYFYKIEDVDLSGFITNHDTMMIETVVDELIIRPIRRPSFRPMVPTELGL